MLIVAGTATELLPLLIATEVATDAAPFSVTVHVLVPAGASVDGLQVSDVTEGGGAATCSVVCAVPFSVAVRATLPVAVLPAVAVNEVVCEPAATLIVAGAETDPLPLPIVTEV